MRTSIMLSVIVWIAVGAMNGNAQTQKNVHSTLNEATLFFRGAELTHSATVSLAKGENEITIDGLSSVIDKNSLKIKATGGAVISAYEFSVDYLTEKTDNPVVKKLTDSIEFYQKKLHQTEVDGEINKQLIDLLQKGTAKNVSGSEKGMTFEELVKTMDYYKTKSTELEAVSTANKEAKTKYETAIKRLRAQLNEESVKDNKATGILKININAPIAVSSSFTFSYFTTAAGWTPYYDINIESTDRPVKITTKAKLRQMTGIEWDKVKLTLSTATPNTGKTAPLFSAWFLDYYYEVRSQALMSQNAYSYSKRSDVMAPSPLMQQDLAEMPTAELVESDAAPNYLYMVNGAEIDRETYSNINPSMVVSRTFIEAGNTKNIWGREADGGWIVEINSGMDDYVSTSENAMDITYNIDIPYSIPGNGKEQSIELKTQETPASYKYYCAPKLDATTYLLAEIANPERLNLPGGKATITYDGAYIGETMINSNTTMANLTLTLGSDKRVSVKREKMQDYSSQKFIGQETEQIFTYRLTVRNGQNKAVQMTLKDQYPISSRKEIKVELLDRTTKPTFNIADTGVLTWEEDLKAGETKVYEISYSVRYPKNRQLNF